ncbi:MAG: hypothetical protein HUJ16_00100 [Kangiella sp.]|nr:hypothetical protein [Kangiella sp.]
MNLVRGYTQGLAASYGVAACQTPAFSRTARRQAPRPRRQARSLRALFAKRFRGK